MQLTTIQPAPTVEQELKTQYFFDFVQWIDRTANTTRTYITNLRQFMAYLKYKAIRQPKREDILSYRDFLTAEHDAIRLDTQKSEGWSYQTDHNGNPLRIKCKPTTITQYLRSVCQFFRWTSSNNLYPDIASNIHAPKIRHNIHRREALTVEEVQIIEKNIVTEADTNLETAKQAKKDTANRIQRTTEQGKRLYAMYLLTVNAGLRTIELSRAKVKDLETKRGKTYLYIWGKGHSEPDQKKPIAPEVAEAIRDYLNSRADTPTGESPLFVATGNRSGGKRIAATTISTMLKKAMQSAGFNSERLTAHSLRHTAGTAVQEITGNLYLTQKYMRHSNPATTEIYLHNDTEKAEAEIAQKLYNYFHSKGKRIIEHLAKLISP